MSSLDRAFFKAYAKDQSAPATEELPEAESVSPYVHYQSPRKPELRYRIEPTHAPWGQSSASRPHVESDRLAAPEYDVYELLEHEDQQEPVAPAAWSAYDAPPVLSPAESPILPITPPLPRPSTSVVLDAILRSMPTTKPLVPECPGERESIEPAEAASLPPPPVSPPVDEPAAPVTPAKVAAPASDPYSSGIVCLPGMEVPESNYLATLLIEKIEVALPVQHEPPRQVQPVQAQVEAIREAIVVDQPISPPVAQIAEAVEPAEALASDAALLADAPAAFWEVDQYLYPQICDDLLQQYSYFKHSGEKLKQAAAGGLKVLSITGIGPQEGRSTLAICLARSAAATGLRVALVDCDFQNPQLAHCLGLEITSGWQSIANTPPGNLAEVAVRSVDDGVLLLPLMDDPATQALTLADDAVAQLVRKAAKSFDVVILDAGAFHENHLPLGQKPCFDAAIVVCDRRHYELSDAEQVAKAISNAGIEAVGIAENFSS